MRTHSWISRVIVVFGVQLVPLLDVFRVWVDTLVLRPLQSFLLVGNYRDHGSPTYHIEDLILNLASTCKVVYFLELCGFVRIICGFLVDKETVSVGDHCQVVRA